MQIILTESFLKRLGNQIDYIAKNNPGNARKFKNTLLGRLKEIPTNPYKYRKSIYFDDDQIRDLVYKGYTIVFRVNNKVIEVFGFVKYQKEPTD